MDEHLRKPVLERVPAESVAAAAIGGGMQTLKMDAFTKVEAHRTTLDELQRVAF